jgi:hypothetical protein
MLSTTHTINDIKKYIVSELKEYGVSTPEELDTMITDAVEDAYLKYLYPALGTYYDDIADKDKTDLTTVETYIYKAEIFFSAGMLLIGVSGKESQKRNTENQSTSVKGQSKSGSGRIGKEKAGGDFINRGFEMMKQAGYVRSVAIDKDGLLEEWVNLSNTNYYNSLNRVFS